MEQTLNDSFDTLLDNNIPEEEDVQESTTEGEVSTEEETTEEETSEEETTTEEENPIYTFLKEKGIKDPSKIQFTNEDDSVEEVDFNETSEEETTTEEENPIYTFLKEKGIKDPSKIQFTNEDDSVEEVDFNNLSKEEQLEVLRSISDPGLTEREINTINYLRQNNATLEQVIDYFSEQRLQQYLQENPDKVHQKSYSIDDYTDDDLYIYDLKQRYPDFTDEEILSELDKAKEDEDIFKRKAEMIRNTFKEQEDQAEQVRIEQEKQQVEDLRSNLMNAAGRFNEVQLDYTDDESDSLIIDDEDKMQMMSYILDQDQEGKSQLIRDLEDPDRLIELAWFATQGPKMLSELNKHWKKQLSDLRSENKKLQSKLDKANNKTSTFVVPPTKQEEPKTIKSAWDNSGLL